MPPDNRLCASPGLQISEAQSDSTPHSSAPPWSLSVSGAACHWVVARGPWPLLRCGISGARLGRGCSRIGKSMGDAARRRLSAAGRGAPLSGCAGPFRTGAWRRVVLSPRWPRAAERRAQTGSARGAKPSTSAKRIFPRLRGTDCAKVDARGLVAAPCKAVYESCAKRSRSASPVRDHTEPPALDAYARTQRASTQSPP
jgi:hypothetical protein